MYVGTKWRMTKDSKIVRYLLGWTMLVLSACGQINDDLSNCEPIQPEEQFELNYELKLVTNMTTELKTQLNTVTEIEVGNALKDRLKGIFSDFARDVDLSFYDVAIDSIRLHHESHVMNDSTGSYTLNLPMREYMHLASANIVDNSLVSIKYDDRCHTACLSQIVGDTIDSHETGLYSARSNMDVLGDVSQTFDVKLYMVNAAAALVVDTTQVKYKSFRAYARGLATEFLMADSTYVFPENSPYVRAKELVLSDTLNQVGFCMIGFPSRNPNGWWIREKTENVAKYQKDVPFTRTEGEIIPEGGSDGEPLWEFDAYVMLEDGSVTKTVLTITEPLLAGELKIIKARMDSKGVVEPTDLKVGVSVTLDWNEGRDFETEL